MTLRAAAEQALDTLEHVQAHIGRYDPPVVATIARSMQPTIDALRAALAAEQPQPEAQPVAWMLTNTAFRQPRYEYFATREQALQRQADFNRSVDDGGLYHLTPLYAAPPPAAVPSAWHAVADWLRDNYQDHPTIADLCDAMRAAAPPPAAPEPSAAQVEAAWRAIPASHEDSRVSVIRKGDVWVMLRAAAAARNNNPA